jgi:molybdopterin-synthase adenylyltransferase
MSDINRQERYVRQTLFAGIGPQGQNRLAQSHALVVGCGALGTHIINTLVRAGVGQLTVVDRDFIELNNLQRQLLFDEADIERGVPKAVAAAEKCSRINSSVVVRPWVGNFDSGRAEALVGPADIVLDATDNFETRYLINDVCVKLGKPWVYGGVVASYGMTMTILPGDTPCFRCVFPEPPAPGVSPTCATIGVLEPAVAMVAALQSMEALKYMSGARDRLQRGLIHVELWESRVLHMNVGPRSPDCPACANGQYNFLDARQGSMAVTLCGRNCVQVMPSTPTELDLELLAQRLSAVGRVTRNAYMLRLSVEGYELTVFPDARTIVGGTVDETVARTLHAKYVGA